MAEFLNRLSSAERRLLSRRKRRALDEMEKVIEAFQQSAILRENQNEVDTLSALLQVLKEPGYSQTGKNWLLVG
jgi:succinate dehydrogenase flavin-adding protein (antitoxin of CptAB toxin-antitoxin module)